MDQELGGIAGNSSLPCDAFHCSAFETLYGGAAGSGKSHLLLGLAKLRHVSVLLLRRTYAQLEDTLILKSKETYGDPRLYNASRHVWEISDGQRIRFGHLEHEQDVYQYQSAEFDLIGFDELTQFTRFQYEYLLSRARTTLPNQNVRIVACTNPGGEGNDWVVVRWAPWLDPTYANPRATRRNSLVQKKRRWARNRNRQKRCLTP